MSRPTTTQAQRVWKIAGSLAVTIPYRVARDLDLAAGDLVLAKFSRPDLSEAAPAAVGRDRDRLLARLAPALAWLADRD